MRGVEWKCIDKIVKLEEESNHTSISTVTYFSHQCSSHVSPQQIQTPHSVERFTYGRSITIGYCYAHNNICTARTKRARYILHHASACLPTARPKSIAKKSHVFRWMSMYTLMLRFVRYSHERRPRWSGCAAAPDRALDPSTKAHANCPSIHPSAKQIGSRRPNPRVYGVVM